MTALSPRLAHLLIHEDRSTGRLILPDGTNVRDTRDPLDASSLPGLSPPLSPLTKPHLPSPSPNERPIQLPSILPHPRDNGDRRQSTSIFSLLNEARPSSPLSRPSPPHAARPLSAQHPPRPLPPTYHISPPEVMSRGYTHNPPHTAHPLSFDNRGSYLQEQQRASTSAGPSSRPDMFRRHSHQAFEYSQMPRPGPYTTATPPGEYSTISGSRAPISRTTKACNACRSRKVRCDAGGPAAGEPTTCSRCKESGVTCVYSGPQKKRGPCPGTVRQVNGNKARRPSNRSSITSIATTTVATPPSEDEGPWTSRSSYGFPPPGSNWPQHRLNDPHVGQPRISSPPRKPSMPVLSWPGMQPAIEVEEPRVLFQDGYSMRPKSGDRREEHGPMDLALPPLRAAIDHRNPHYGH